MTDQYAAATATWNLSGKVAIVTGGSRGLGREIALALGAAGASVVVSSRKLDVCCQVVDLITAAGGSAVAYSCHVGHWDELDPLIECAVEEFGRLDILINNAGMSPVYESLPEVSEAMFDSVVGVNLKGPFRLAILAAERMLIDGGGSIVNISSTASVMPHPAAAPYSAAKAGLDAITEALARGYGPTVRVNSVQPGPFETDVAAHWDPEWSRTRTARMALRRIGDPREIVDAVLYFASDASSFCTGSRLRVDGGTR